MSRPIINDGQFNQISWYMDSKERWIETRNAWIKSGYPYWTIDYCIQTAPQGWHEPTVTAMLAFNFDIIPGFQYELLYWDPKNLVVPAYHPALNGQPQLSATPSHMAYYSQDVRAETKRINAEFGIEPIYRFTTLDHSNPYLTGRTRFVESLWDTRDKFGFYMKTVQKIGWNSDEMWSDWDGSETS